MMITNSIFEVFERDLSRLSAEIAAYKDEKDMWLIKPGISNSGGNLCLHLVGGLNHFIGATLNNTGYVRNRDAEFSLKDIPRTELISGIEKAIGMIKGSLDQLSLG
jgi:hypothetical protein